MSDKNTIDMRNMQLHEIYQINDTTSVMRVMGGYIYTQVDYLSLADGYTTSQVFVPMQRDEFLTSYILCKSNEVGGVSDE